jgi:hypothetical protein
LQPQWVRTHWPNYVLGCEKGGRANLFRTYRGQPDEELSVPTIVEQLVTYGRPDQVTEKVLAFGEQVGDFGTCSTRVTTGSTRSSPEGRWS